MSERDKVLDKILGVPGAAAKLRKGVRTMKETLDEQGLQPRNKSLKRHKGVMEEAGGKLDEVKAMLSDDPNLAQELLEFMMDMLGGHAEPDGDDMGAGQEEAFEEDYEDEFEEEYEAVKAQPGYGEMEPNTSAELVNQAITKKPGTFPKPVSHQVETGKGKRRGKALGNDDKLIQAVKSLADRITGIEEALGELADVPEKLKALSPSEINRAFMPQQASLSSATVATDPKLEAKAKELLDADHYDAFWGGKVRK